MTLTLAELKAMEPETIFAYGIHRRIGAWAAIRGGIHDWAVYSLPFVLTANPPDAKEVVRQGSKEPRHSAGILVHS